MRSARTLAPARSAFIRTIPLRPTARRLPQPLRPFLSASNTSAAQPATTAKQQLLTLAEIDRLLTHIAQSSSTAGNASPASPLVMRAHPVPWMSSSSPELEPSGAASGAVRTGDAPQERKLSQEEMEELVRPKHMSESYTSFDLPLASDPKLYERYVNTSGGFRMGKLLEHLDSLAGAVAYRHCLPASKPSGNGDRSPDAAKVFRDASARAGIYLATASADRLDMFARLNRENVRDLKFSGFVTWTGNSSMEVFVKMEGTRPGSPPQSPADTLMLGRFSMVCRDSHTHKARRVPPLIVESDEEKTLWAIGEEHKRTKLESSASALDKVPPSSAEVKELHDLMLVTEKATELDGEEIVHIKDTEIQSVQLMFPQDRNLHGKVFGGILMRMAFELCFTNSAIFAGKPMRFLSLDQITFRLPVPIGAVLRLTSKVVKTTQPHEGVNGEAKVHVVVRAEVEEVETGVRRETNTFFFTMAKEDHEPIGRIVVPSTYSEAMAYLEGSRRLEVGDEVRQLYLATSSPNLLPPLPPPSQPLPAPPIAYAHAPSSTSASASGKRSGGGIAVTSPQSASPSVPLPEWDEAGVHSYFCHLGLDQYEDAIYEHGITGDVLCEMNNETLLDLGMASLGHRLNVLRAVFELKKEQGVEMNYDDWRPHEEVALEAMETAATIDRMWNLVLEQHERLVHLEHDHSRLLNVLHDSGIVIPAAPEPAPPATLVVGHQPPKISDPPQTAPQPRTVLHDSQAPATAIATSAIHSPSQLGVQSAGGGSRSASSKPPPSSRLASKNVPETSASQPVRPPRPPGLGADSVGVGSGAGSVVAGAPLPLSPTPDLGSSTGTSASGQGGSRTVVASDRSKAKDAANSAAKSFRVTMEDPCWKVLPAALKKYKINDDWKMYALFICFGNTERCLSYDEKPLLLFQKLKESGQRPVFMLRHIRDIKSPIAVAQQKQAIKLGLPPNSTVKLLPSIDTPATSPTKIATVRPSVGATRSGDDNHTPNTGIFPEIPSPSVDGGHPPRSAGGPPGTLVDRDGNVQKVTYAISIYPYIADRQDEFDVAVGATFVVMSKAKGWWFVQKDPEGQGNIISDATKSGWVPAGCLLELSAPVSAVSPTSATMFPGRSPLALTAIMSSSYPGVVLMDYEAKGDDELSLKEGEKIRVYKKYCHWSYSIKQGTGERGWVPSWFVGKLAVADNQTGSGVIAPSVTSSDTAGNEVETLITATPTSRAEAVRV